MRDCRKSLGVPSSLIKFSESMILYDEKSLYSSPAQKFFSCAPKRYADSRSQNVCGLFSFCKSSRQMIGGSCPCPILLSEDRASRLIHLQEAFAKTRKATNILRPAIDTWLSAYLFCPDMKNFFPGLESS